MRWRRAARARVPLAVLVLLPAAVLLPRPSPAPPRAAAPAAPGSHGAGLVWYASGPDGAALESQSADVPINPASLVKVATTLWALERLGPEHRFATRFGRRGDDLLVQGGADPDFQPENAFAVAAALNQQGVRRVAGRLLVDSAFWIGWENGPERREPDPGRRARGMASRLQRSLDPTRWDADMERIWADYARRTGKDPARPPGVAVEGGAGVVDDPGPDPVHLLTHLSRPLAETLKRFNAYSNNDIGRLDASLGPPADLTAFLAARWGAATGGAPRFTSLSGLGQSRMTPRDVVRLLRDLQATAARHGLSVSDLLPAAGCDPGTLETFRRLDLGGPGASVVVGKTGTLTHTDGGVAVLAGYARTVSGELIFCVAAPRSGQRLLAARRQQEDWVVGLLARHGGAAPTGCPPPLPLSGDGIRLLAAGQEEGERSTLGTGSQGLPGGARQSAPGDGDTAPPGQRQGRCPGRPAAAG